MKLSPLSFLSSKSAHAGCCQKPAGGRLVVAGGAAASRAHASAPHAMAITSRPAKRISPTAGNWKVRLWVKLRRFTHVRWTETWTVQLGGAGSGLGGA